MHFISNCYNEFTFDESPKPGNVLVGIQLQGVLIFLFNTTV